MSSRQEEKQRRRQERLEAEQEAARRAQTRKRLWIVGGAVLGVAAVAAVVVAVVAATGGDDDHGAPGQKAGNEGEIARVAIPPQGTADLQDAVKAAGCTLRTFPSEGREHTQDVTQPVEYRTNPPTLGTHYQVAADDGDYSGEDPPPLTASVHSLEHGRINIQYKAGTPERRIGQLRTLYDEQGGYHALLFENQSGMKAAVAATAWTQQLTCPEFSDEVFDAIRAFRARYTDQGPEPVP